MQHPLDNPAWHSLNGPQREFGRATGLAARYHSEISPIAAIADESDAAFRELAALTKSGETVAVICERAFPEQDWQMVGRVELNQWLHDGTPVDASLDHDIAMLGAADAAEMLALARLADPGPFELRTWQLGAYFGIRADDALVAMAGERMRLPGFAEVSAVATRPGYEGRGHATRLVKAVLAREIAAREQSFLHVRRGSPAERAASRVYEKLGFRVRCRAAFQAVRRR